MLTRVRKRRKHGICFAPSRPHAAKSLSLAEREPPAAAGESLYTTILKLAPKDDAQRVIRSEALRLASDLRQVRWIVYEQRSASLPRSLLIVLVVWLSVVFAAFGLFAPMNATVAASLFVSALSVAGVVLLILDMYSPFGGLIQP